jgi:hypothetical protein
MAAKSRLVTIGKVSIVDARLIVEALRRYASGQNNAGHTAEGAVIGHLAQNINDMVEDQTN